jgi:nitric oxide reductase subunit B
MVRRDAEARLAHNFWFGHQGWEYTDIGRFWQISCSSDSSCGWCWSAARCGRRSAARRHGVDRRPHVPVDDRDRLLYGAGLMWSEHTHLSMVEYWRWWVVHLWVEGFFEVFATAVISFLLVKLG